MLLLVEFSIACLIHIVFVLFYFILSVSLFVLLFYLCYLCVFSFYSCIYLLYKLYLFIYLFIYLFCNKIYCKNILLKDKKIFIYMFMCLCCAFVDLLCMYCVFAVNIYVLFMCCVIIDRSLHTCMINVL